jgi:hypothetical protein
VNTLRKGDDDDDDNLSPLFRVFTITDLKQCF